MGSTESGIFGIMRGKTSDINFKYSRGKNVASKYVSNPKNPKTIPQISQRGKFAFLVNALSVLNPLFLSLVFNPKTPYKRASGKLISLVSQSDGWNNLQFMPAVTTIKELWDEFVSNLPDMMEERFMNVVKPPSCSIVFDRMSFNAHNYSSVALVCSVAISDINNKLKEIPRFIIVQLWDNTLETPSFAVLSICQHNYNTATPSGSHYVSIPQYYANINGHPWILLWTDISCPMIPSVISDLSLYQQYQLTKSDGNFNSDIINFLPCDQLKKLPISTASGKAQIKTLIETYEDIPDTYAIDRNFNINPNNLIVDFTYEAGLWTLSGSLDFDLPEIYKGLPWALFYYHYALNKDLTPVLTYIQTSDYINNFSLNVTLENTSVVLNGYFVIVVNSAISSVPIRAMFKNSVTISAEHSNYSYFGDSLYRDLNFCKNYNFCIRAILNTNETYTIGNAVNVELNYLETPSIDTIILNSVGMGVFKIPSGRTLVSVVVSKIGYNEQVFTVNKHFDDFCLIDMGRITLLNTKP